MKWTIRALALTLGAATLAACGGTTSAPAPSQASAGPAKASVASQSTSAGATAGSAAAGRPSTAAPAGAYQPTPLNPPVKVSVGLLGSSSDGGIFIAQDKGYFKQEGIELDLQRFSTLVDMVAPVSAGQLDIAAGGLAAGLYNAIGRDVDLRIVADKGSTPSPDFDFAALMVRKDLIDSGKVKDYADLKGLKCVTSGKGNSPEVALATALGKGGLTLKDIDFTQMGFPDMAAAFSNKAIDCGIVIEPFVSQIQAAGTAVRWKGNLDIIGGNEQIAVIVYGPKLNSNQDLARHWMLAYIRGLRDYNDAFGPKKQGTDEVIQILTKDTTIKDPKVYQRMKPAGLDADGKLDVKSIQDDVNYYQKAGELKVQPDLKKIIDTSYQEYAVKTLGPYKAG